MEQKIIKNCEVEVSSEEEGFRGAWFRAILEENPTNSGRKKLRCRYLTLLEEDCSTPLKEMIDQSSIRPTPPENLYEGVVLVEGSAVDANYKDGWWTGVVLKKSEDENKKESFLVYFDSPPDIIRFERNQLRPHLDWTGWKWVRPELTELSKSEFRPGTMIEVSSMIDKIEIAWSPAMIIKEIEIDSEKKFIVKYCNKDLSFSSSDEATTPNSTVDSRYVRPTPPLSLVEGPYELLERVEAFRGSSWRHGMVRGVLNDGRYMVSIEATKDESVFKHSDLRPFKVWEDGIWHNRPKQNPVQETSPKVFKRKPTRCSSTAAANKPMTPLTTPKRVTKVIKRPLILEENGGTRVTKAETVVTATGEFGKKKSDAVVIIATPIKQKNAESERKKSPEKKTVEPKKNQNGLGNGSTPEALKKPEEENSEEQNRKRKREQELNSETGESCNNNSKINETSKKICNEDDNIDDQPLATWIGISTELSSTRTPKAASNSVVAVDASDVEVTQSKDITVLPFTKKSPYWKTVESTEGYKLAPQRPHFSPLFEEKESLREWSAVGMTVTFYGLVDEVKDLPLDVSTERLHSLNESFIELERHGFEVEMVQSRVNKVLDLKDEQEKKKEERKRFEMKIEEEEKEKRKVDEEKIEIARKILELKRQEVVAKEKGEAMEKNIAEMTSCVGRIRHEIEEMDVEFQKIVSAPW